MQLFDKKNDNMILFAKDVARFLGISERTAIRRMKKDIASMRTGGLWTTTTSALREYVKKNSNQKMLEIIQKKGY